MSHLTDLDRALVWLLLLTVLASVGQMVLFGGGR
jgi:hypothetical protein